MKKIIISSFFCIGFSAITVAQDNSFSRKSDNPENKVAAEIKNDTKEEAPKAAKFATRKRPVAATTRQAQDSTKATTKPSNSFTRKESYGNN